MAQVVEQVVEKSVPFASDLAPPDVMPTTTSTNGSAVSDDAEVTKLRRENEVLKEQLAKQAATLRALESKMEKVKLLMLS